MPKQLQPLWAELHRTQGGAELEQWVDELLYLDHGINPPKKLLETLSHNFNIRDADSATLLSSMLDWDDDGGVEMEDSAFTYADTARDDNPDYWQPVIDAELWVSPEQASAEAGDTPVQGK